MIRNQCNTCQYDYNCTIQEKKSYKYDDIVCEEYVPPLNNSKGMFRRLFSYKGRIRRLEFGLSYILLNVLYYLFVAVLFAITGSENLPMTLILPIALGLLVILCLQGIKRCHDLGKSGWWIIIPYYNPFVLIFMKGNDGINEYGTDPKRSYESQVFQSLNNVKEQLF